jgi:hypothetical protein
MRQILVSALLFTLIGPAVGAIFANIYLQWPLSAPLSEYFSGGMFFIYLMSLFVGYIFGAIPAALAGSTYAAIISKIFNGHRPSLLMSLIVASVIGFAATLIPLLLVLSHKLDPLAFGLSGIGALSSAVCSLFVRRTWVGPNNSFKPKPLRGSA